MDLITFLCARLDEDEQTARAAGNRHWLVQDNIIELYPEREDDGFMCWPTRADARHAANWDPARVLAEVEAKRQIIEHNTRLHQMADPATHPGQEYVLAAGASDRVLRILALPYADHRDYREEWRA